MPAKRFSTPVESQGPGGAWSSIAIPFSVEKEWRSKGALKVRGTLNGQPIRTSVFPNGDGSHHMMLNKELLSKAKCFVGDTVEVELEPDTEPRVYEMPKDLAKAVKADRKAAATWAAFPPSAHKLYVDWVEAAKRPETRASRVAKAVALLAEGKRLK